MSSGERAYVYAKACGMIAKSFLEGRAFSLGTAGKSASLAAVTSLDSLYRLVFAGENEPASAQPAAFQRRIIDRTVRQCLTLLSAYARPTAFLVCLMRSYEYADVKSVLSALAGKEEACPPHTALGRFSTVRFDLWPDLDKMLEGTEFMFLLEKENRSSPPARLHTLLDQHYYSALLAALDRARRFDTLRIREILTEEIALNNAAWVLRLRTYYNLDRDEIRASLVEPGDGAYTRDALEALDFSLDTLADWGKWRRRGFLNKEESGVFWKADPRHFETASSVYLYQKAARAFRQRPFALDTLACFIRLKQFEEQLLCGLAEAVSLGMSGAEVLSMMGAGLKVSAPRSAALAGASKEGKR